MFTILLFNTSVLNMNFNKKEYFQLVDYSHKLESQGKSLRDENPEMERKLLDYQVVIEEHVFWEKRGKFILNIENFINGVVDAEYFSNTLWMIRNEIMNIVELKINEINQLKDFEPDPHSKGFSNLIDSILNDCDSFEPTADENEELSYVWLKKSAKNTMLRLKKYL